MGFDSAKPKMRPAIQLIFPDFLSTGRVIFLQQMLKNGCPTGCKNGTSKTEGECVQYMSVQFEKEEGLKKELKDRHIQLIAIGGVIGVALFMGSAGTVKLAGPSASLAYVIGGIVMFFVMRALGEIAVEYPVSSSFAGYAKAFIGPRASFITGWTYWFMWATIAMCEISAVGMFMKYWYADIQQWIVAIITLIIMTGVNLIAVKLYGELEFWFAGIKVVAIVFMLIVGTLMIVFGIGNNGVPVGVANLFSHGGYFRMA